MIFVWAVAGVLLLAGFMYSVRIMRKGITTLDDDRAQYLERIREGERQLAEDRKNISMAEHLHILHAGVRDLLRLAGDPPDFSLAEDARGVVLHTPDGDWRLELHMREALLRGSRKSVHGQSRWLLRGFGREEHFEDLAGLMHALHQYLHGKDSLPPRPEHLERRLVRRPGKGRR
ncbi:MAG: translation initiation factor IF-2 [Desulfovibrio sp.]|nr:translation initiation factor IF-2 [Desulfovibrio sp.]